MKLMNVICALIVLVCVLVIAITLLAWLNTPEALRGPLR